MVVRHTRVVSRKLIDNALRTYDVYHAIADKALITRHGSPAFIADSLYGSAYVQAGSLLGSGYWEYPKEYTRVHGAAAAPLGWYDTGYSPGRIDRVLTGCAYVMGSPEGYSLVVVKGDL